jgi:hypothetical protein
MRVWCNTVKAALLGSIHEPLKPQTYRVVQHPLCPIANASTWLTWWNGDAVPRPGHIASAEQLVPASSQLLDLRELSTPLQRNLHAIDLLRLEVHSIGTAQRERGDPAWRLLRSIGRIWCGNLALARKHLQDSGRQFAPGFDITPLLEYSALEPVSAFRYLMRLATSSKVNVGGRLLDWSLDLATAAMAIRTLVEVADIEGSAIDVLGIGATFMMTGLAGQTYWTAPEDFDASEHVLYASHVFRNSSPVALAALERAQDAYFMHYQALGIGEKVVRNLLSTSHVKSPDRAFQMARAPF